MSRTRTFRGVGFKTVISGVNILFKEKDPTKRVVPLIIGEQGIGKSQLVQKIASDLNAFYREMTCSLMQEGDLLLPVLDRDDKTVEEDGTMGRVKYALHTMLVDLIDNAKVNPDQPQILFLDEFNRASVAVQAELMNLVLQREIAGIKLPDNVRLILASNPSSDIEGFENSEYHVNSADGAINDRTTRIIMHPNIGDWMDNFAKVVVNADGRTKVHNMVISFLEDGNDRYFLEEDNQRDKKATPRAWERVSNILYRYEDEGIEYGPNEHAPFINESIRGTVGNETGSLFITYMNDATFFIRPWDIINADEQTHEGLFNRFKSMQEVRRNRIVESLVDQFALVKNQNTLLQPKHTNRLVEWILALNEDSAQTMMLKIADASKDNEFINFETLYNAIAENDEEGKYINKELEYTLRVSMLEN